MKLGLLTPRYGTEVIGGTEHWLRTLAEHLVADRDWQVEVHTTCAVSAQTWANEYPPATTDINGVTVHRHSSRSTRDPGYLHLLPRLRRDPQSFTEDEARRYIRLVGPICPGAVQAVTDFRGDLVAVTPYLYWPTIEAVPRLGRRVVFHGATHDEPELYLPLMPPVFTSVGGFAFNTYSERALVERTFPVAHLPSAVIGHAVDPGRGDPDVARRHLGLEPGEPFVVCLGRVEHSKGAGILAEMWQMYCRRHRDAPRLVFLGPVHDRPPTDPHIVVAGAVPEDIKWGALAGCDVLISPSAQESFGLVVLEAWLAGTPVMVNGRCGPTVELCGRSGGGIWFDEYADFEAGVERLVGEVARPLRRRLAERGRRYAEETFSWPAILDRYEELTEQVRQRNSAFARDSRPVGRR